MERTLLMTSPKFRGLEAYAQDYLRAHDGRLADYKINGVIEPEELLERVRGAQALVAGPDRVTAQVMDAAGGLKIIHVPGVGYDHVDVDAATQRGIPVCTCAGSNADAVAETALTHMLCLATRAHLANGYLHAGEWKTAGGKRFELTGKALGIVGFGHIGRALARRAAGLGMKLLVFDVFPNEAAAAEFGASFVPFDELIARSDFISLHCPASEKTKNLISKPQLAAMKPTAYLINTARGSLVDTKALLWALDNGEIAGAGLDVFEREPWPEHPFAKYQNVFLTPHMGGVTEESRLSGLQQALEHIVQAFEGGHPDCCVNPRIWE